MLTAPRHPYTQALISVLPDTDRDRPPTLLAGEPPDPTAIPDGCRFHPRCPLHASLDPADERAALCRSVPLPVLPAGGREHRVACHLAEPA